LPCKEEDEEETEKSKQCALICIEEILNLPVIWIDEKLQKEQPENYEPESTIEFWEQVKVEIEKQ